MKLHSLNKAALKLDVMFCIEYVLLLSARTVISVCMIVTGSFEA